MNTSDVEYIIPEGREVPSHIKCRPRDWAPWLLFCIVPLLAYPMALSSSWKSDSDVHALLEFAAAAIAITAAITILIHFFATGNRFFLFIALGFTQQGSVDFIHAIFSFKRIWSIAPAGMEHFIPGTYVAGRIILIVCLGIALYFTRFGHSLPENKRLKEAIKFLTSGFIIGTLGTYLIIHSPIPNLILPGRLISRPVDFITALFYLLAFFAYARIYCKTRYHSPFMWSMIGSIILGFVTQVYMIHSYGLYDAQFDISHVVKIISYILPILGIGVGSYTMYKKEAVLVRQVKRSKQKEAQQAADAAIFDLQKQKAGELESINKKLQAGEQQLRAANQALTSKEQALLNSNAELENKMKEVNRFNKIMVNRELTMIKLKTEVNQLLGRLGEPKKYNANAS